jgi:hypothetical protein
VTKLLHWIWAHAVFLALIALWLVGSLALLEEGLSGPEQEGGPRNAASRVDCATSESVADGKEPATLAANGTMNVVVPFGRNSGEIVRELEFAVDDPGQVLPKSSELNGVCLTTYVSPFISDTGESQLDVSKIGTILNLHGDRAVLTVKLMRQDATFGPPGSYTGLVGIIDPRVERIDIPMTVTLADPSWQTTLAIALLMLGPAVAYVWLVRGSFAGGGRLKLRDFEAYITDRNGLLTLLAGLTAAGAVFLSSYIGSPTWGSSTGQRIAFYVSLFTAFTAASTPVAAAGKDDPAGRV